MYDVLSGILLGCPAHVLYLSPCTMLFLSNQAVPQNCSRVSSRPGVSERRSTLDMNMTAAFSQCLEVETQNDMHHTKAE
jgi:hypothetical protein